MLIRMMWGRLVPASELEFPFESLFVPHPDQPLTLSFFRDWRRAESAKNENWQDSSGKNGETIYGNHAVIKQRALIRRSSPTRSDLISSCGSHLQLKTIKKSSCRFQPSISNVTSFVFVFGSPFLFFFVLPHFLRIPICGSPISSTQDWLNRSQVNLQNISKYLACPSPQSPAGCLLPASWPEYYRMRFVTTWVTTDMWKVRCASCLDGVSTYHMHIL